MKILLTNDDGIDAPGLTLLAKELSNISDVMVVAPSTQKSALSHAITIYSPIILREHYIEDAINYYSLDGTPADCVKIGLMKFCSTKPDFVISGINPGANLGINLFYSGTVAAAIEGAMNGIPSFALSLDVSHSHKDFSIAVKLSVELIENFFNQRQSLEGAFNINLPNLSKGEIKGIRLTSQDETYFKDNYYQREDPRKTSYFWINEQPQIGHSCSEPITPNINDVSALFNGFISITPLIHNLTNFRQIDKYNYIENFNLKLGDSN